MRIIVALDALDFNKVQASECEWFKETGKEYKPNTPRVTPWIFSQILTGRQDEKYRRSTPYKKPRVTDLEGHTIFHDCTDKGLKVFAYGFPLCANIKLPEGSLTTFDHFLGPRQNVPPVLKMARAGGNPEKDDKDNIFNAMVDETTAMFANMRNFIRNNKFDVVFLYYQLFDACTHIYRPDDYISLMRLVEAEIKQTGKDLKAPIFYFSDHGSMEAKGYFHVNRWLKEKGYLDYEINEDYAKFHKAECVVLQSPFVKFNKEKSQFACFDAFDCMIDVLQSKNEDKLVRDLMDTGYFEKIIRQGNLVIPTLKEGYIASNNLILGSKFEKMRNGWHSDHAIVGCTEFEPKAKNPCEVYEDLKKFCLKEEPKKEEKKEEDVNDDLAALGYL